MRRDEVMRWILEDIGGEGVTVRLCVRHGEITSYVSQVTAPNDVMYDNISTIGTTDKLAVDCSTIFTGTYHMPGTKQKRQQASQTAALYLSIEGHDSVNTFSMQSGNGNVTFGKHAFVTLIFV